VKHCLAAQIPRRPYETPNHFITEDLDLVKLEANEDLDLQVVVEEVFVLDGRRIKRNSLYISWVSREYEDEQGMKTLMDGVEDDVVGYQPEGYAELVMVMWKIATNQSAFRDKRGGCCRVAAL
jgi:hypothetical protein